MSYENILKSTEEFAQERLSGEPTGHDWWHANRVRNLAKHIHASEGGEWEVIEPAALLHDIGDRKVIGEENDDYSIAEDFLAKQNIQPATIRKIMHIIQTMSFSKSFEQTETQKTIELQIVQDADRVDALGAIGIARAFAFGGSRGRPLYDPTYTPQVFTTSTDYKAAHGSTLHHFDEKLFLLKNTFNTQAGKKIAKERDAYMHAFYERFLVEWEGIADS